MGDFPLVYIIIVNWNGWRNTVECLESVFRIDYPNFRVIICDNFSKDNSLKYLHAWANGELNFLSYSPDFIKKHTFPPVKKPINVFEIEQSQLPVSHDILQNNEKLIFIKARKNLGFSGGNNLGLRFALDIGEFDFIWLLNNDTVVTKSTLSEMIIKVNNKPKIGICGSTLLYYDKPNIIQALGGGVYNKWLGRTRFIGTFQQYNQSINRYNKSQKMSFVSGASMLLRKEAISQAGLFTEIYFLYFEELDYLKKLKDKFELDYAHHSMVYHKEGESIGSSNKNSQKPRSILSEYFGIRNKLLFTRFYFPYALPTIFFSTLMTIAKATYRKQWNRIPIFVEIIVRFALNLSNQKKLLEEFEVLTPLEQQLIENQEKEYYPSFDFFQL